MYFDVQIKQSGKPEKLVVFFCVDRTRRGLVGLKYIYVYINGLDK